MPNINLDMLVEQTFIAGGEHHRVISSTNDRARELAADNRIGLPWLIVADEQTAGRGRGGNRWWTGAGSLAMSLLLDPWALGVRRPDCGLLSLASAVAIVDFLAPLVEPEIAGLHWPNDVYVGSRKMAGILVEGLSNGRHIVGIGLNVNNSLRSAPVELQNRVTSLIDLTGRQYPRSAVLVELLSQLEQAFRQLADSPEGIGLRANDLCLQHGTSLTIEFGGQMAAGRCLGIATDGALRLATDDGERRFYAGVLRRPEDAGRR